MCSLIEYIGRKTKNNRGDVVNKIGYDGILKLLKDAEVNHCLSFEQVSDENIEYYGITNGNFDTITNCKYSVPGYTDIGRLYSLLIENLAEKGEEAKMLMNIFNSFISDEISNFKTGVYFENPSYLQESFKEGYLLD
ncbi:MAG: hypothetical protein LIO44_00285 [Eubacterium sp.]|nr:hypothetical protein [Eubacterium sp.]